MTGTEGSREAAWPDPELLRWVGEVATGSPASAEAIMAGFKRGFDAGVREGIRRAHEAVAAEYHGGTARGDDALEADHD